MIIFVVWMPLKTKFVTKMSQSENERMAIRNRPAKRVCANGFLFLWIPAKTNILIIKRCGTGGWNWKPKNTSNWLIAKMRSARTHTRTQLILWISISFRPSVSGQWVYEKLIYFKFKSIYIQTIERSPMKMHVERGRDYSRLGLSLKREKKCDNSNRA